MMMALLDETLIEGLQILKNDFGVTYTHIAKQIGVSTSILTRFKDGDTNVLGYEKKMELLKWLNEYLDRLTAKGD